LVRFLSFFDLKQMNQSFCREGDEGLSALAVVKIFAVFDVLRVGSGGGGSGGIGILIGVMAKMRMRQIDSVEKEN
jgi:hypothetical protein